MAELNRPQDSPGLLLAAAHHRQIIEIAQSADPLEACGILAGDGVRSRQVIEIANLLASPTRYRMAPDELVRAFWDLESDGLSVLAFFHSHPASPPRPSAADLNEHHYPDIPMIIIGRIARGWDVRAFLLQDQRSQEIPIQYY